MYTLASLQPCETPGFVEKKSAYSELHHGAILHQGQVQPSTAPSAPCGGAVLMTHLLKHLTDLHLRDQNQWGYLMVNYEEMLGF